MHIAPAQAETISNAIFRVCSADSVLEALALFQNDRKTLEHSKFLFASENADAATPGLSVNRDFANGAAVRSLFPTRHVVVLDCDTISEMRSGMSTFEIDYSISLDTNALSYLLPYLENRTSQMPSDFGEVFAFIAHPDTNVDPLPYRMENLLNLTGHPDQDARIYARIRAYEILRTLDPATLGLGPLRSYLTDIELTKRAQEQMASLYTWMNTPSLIDPVFHNHATMYCLLMKMCTIQLARPKAKSMSKMDEFLEFCDQRIATIFARETMLAKRYFEDGQTMPFFSKIMIGGKQLLKRLHSMAWDLCHVRHMESMMTMRPKPGARYFFPAFLTFDKGLIDIINIYPLRAFGYDERLREPCAIYAGDWLNEIAGDEIGAEAVVRRFYSTQARAHRNSVRDSRKQGLPALIDELESSFKRVANL